MHLCPCAPREQIPEAIDSLRCYRCGGYRPRQDGPVPAVAVVSGLAEELAVRADALLAAYRRAHGGGGGPWSEEAGELLHLAHALLARSAQTLESALDAAELALAIEDHPAGQDTRDRP